MATPEDLSPNAIVRGLVPEGLATVVAVNWLCSEALELTYKDHAGRIAVRPGAGGAHVARRRG